MVVDFDPVDDRAQIGLPERNLAIDDVFAHFPPELLDHFRGDFSRRNSLSPDAIKRGLCPLAVEFEAGDAITQDIVQFGDAVFHHAIEPLQLVGGIDHLALQGGDARVDLDGPFGAAGKGGGENLGEAFGSEQSPRQVVDDEVVERIHADGAPLASRLSHSGTGRAGIVFVDGSGLRSAGAERHGGATRRAGCQPGEQNRSGDNPWCGYTRIVGLERCLDGIELGSFNDRWHLDRDPLVNRLLTLRSGVALIKNPLTDINAVRQNGVERRHSEPCAKASAIATLVEPDNGLLDAEWSRLSITVSIEAKDQPDGFGFGGINHEFLFDPSPALFIFLRAIAEWNTRAIIETLSCVLVHSPEDMFCVFTALIFVEQGDHLSHHHLSRIVAQFLRDRNKAHAGLGKATDIHFQSERITEEARVRVYDDDVEWPVIVGGALDHLLEFSTIVVHGGRAGLDKLGYQRPFLVFAERGDLLALIGNRQVAFGLSSGRDA